MHRLILLVLAAAALLGLLLVLRRRSARRPPEAVEPAEPAALPETPETVESPRAAEATAVETEAEPAAPPEEEPGQAPAETGTAAAPAEAGAAPLPQAEAAAPCRRPEPATAEPVEPVAAPAGDRSGGGSNRPLRRNRLHRLRHPGRPSRDRRSAPPGCTGPRNSCAPGWRWPSPGGTTWQRDRLQRALVLLNDRLVHLADSCAEEDDCRTPRWPCSTNWPGMGRTMERPRPHAPCARTTPARRKPCSLPWARAPVRWPAAPPCSAAGWPNAGWTWSGPWPCTGAP